MGRRIGSPPGDKFLRSARRTYGDSPLNPDAVIGNATQPYLPCFLRPERTMPRRVLPNGGVEVRSSRNIDSGNMDVVFRQALRLIRKSSQVRSGGSPDGRLGSPSP